MQSGCERKAWKAGKGGGGKFGIGQPRSYGPDVSAASHHSVRHQGCVLYCAALLLPCRFAASLKLFKMKEAAECAAALRQADTWRALALAALDILDIDMAIQAYRQVGLRGSGWGRESGEGWASEACLPACLLCLC